jgi:predicted phage terminase large subunit-like protein
MRCTESASVRSSVPPFVVLYPSLPFIPNWHINAICYAIEQMVTGENGNFLVVNLPPRTLKSFILSVCLPAWLLGRNPGENIVCASYSRDLADKFSRDCRALMETTFYKRVFPRTRLNPRKTTEAEFETMERGYRLATSVGATLTGRGGRILIVDDALKGGDADSRVALDGVNEWFRNTAMNRLDSLTDCLIIVTMQRLHQNDLSGMLIKQGWPCLAIPMIAQEPADILIGKDVFYHRPAGEALQPNRDSLDALQELKRQVGSRIWAAQYDQNPTPPEGNMVKAASLARYDFLPAERKFRRVVLSCDPAGKPGAHNDYTAIVICGFDIKPIYLLHVERGHWTVLEMRRRIEVLAPDWKVDLVIIEDSSSGMGLIQMLREDSSLLVKGLRPDADKEVRMSRHQARFEAGNILLPKEAPWLAEFEAELLNFPNDRYDDQVDALLLFLDWFPKANRYNPPPSGSGGLPIVG